MEKYDRDGTEEIDVFIPFPEDVIGQHFAKIEVKTGSRIFNLVKFALTSLEKDVKIVISANGPAVTKAVTIAEIIKRRKPKISQWNKINFKKIKEFWKPTEVGASRIKVTREVPSLHILLSTASLNPSFAGVQIAKKTKTLRPNTSEKKQSEQHREKIRKTSKATSDDVNTNPV